MTKRIIDGKTYNTETATCLAKETFAPGGYGGEFDDLYQTRHGAYFRHHGNWGSTNHAGDVLEVIEPLTPPEAQKWMEARDFTELLEKHFGEQPEAGETESRITVRIPDVLKYQIEGLAGKNGQSLNAWIMRCVENCAAQQPAYAIITNRELPMTAMAISICITVDPELTLPNTAPSQPVRLKGNYIAFPEQDSDPRAYKLHQADSTWAASETPTATVFLVIDKQGQVKIS